MTIFKTLSPVAVIVYPLRSPELTVSIYPCHLEHVHATVTIVIITVYIHISCSNPDHAHIDGGCCQEWKVSIFDV